MLHHVFSWILNFDVLIFLFQSIQKYDVVDIFGIVYEMRKARFLMVQTEQQYIYIHQCLLTVLKGKESGPWNRENSGTCKLPSLGKYLHFFWNICLVPYLYEIFVYMK